MIEEQSACKEESVQLKQYISSLNEVIAEDKVPSYVGVSCAVSGYRALNKYDAAIREELQAENSPTRIALPRGPDGKILQISFDVVANEFERMANELRPSKPLKNGHYIHKLVPLKDDLQVEGPETRNLPTKSIIQQRIERLYGPGAFGMGFQTRRVMLERQVENLPNDPNIEKSPENLPSVFRHLRPEFRYQLPVKTVVNVQNNKCDNSRNKSNNFCVKLNNVNIVNGHERISSSKYKRPPPSETIKLIDATNTKLISNGVLERVKVEQEVIDEVSDSMKESKLGHYFLKIVDEEVLSLQPRVRKIEDELKRGEQMSEEVRGKLLAAVGKTKLLIDQKVEQFKGLCNKNLVGIREDEFPTTNEDLAGFWDMVSIQMDHIKELLSEVDKLREKNWKDDLDLETLPSKTDAPKVESGKKERPAPSGPKGSEASEGRRRATREALKAKRREASKLKDREPLDQVQIFVAAEKKTQDVS